MGETEAQVCFQNCLSSFGLLVSLSKRCLHSTMACTTETPRLVCLQPPKPTCAQQYVEIRPKSERTATLSQCCAQANKLWCTSADTLLLLLVVVVETLSLTISAPCPSFCVASLCLSLQKEEEFGLIVCIFFSGSAF